MYIYWPRKRATQRGYSANLSLLPESFALYWKGVRGLKWHQLYFHLSQLYQIWPPNYHTDVDFLSMLKRDLYHFHLTSPGTTIIFFEIVPAWLSSPMYKVMEKMRKRVNRAVAKYLVRGFFHIGTWILRVGSWVYIGKTGSTFWRLVPLSSIWGCNIALRRPCLWGRPCLLLKSSWWGRFLGILKFKLLEF